MAFINDIKTMLSDLSTALKVGNADAGSYFNDLVLGDVDYGVSVPFNNLSSSLPRYRWPTSIRGSPMSVSRKPQDGLGNFLRIPTLP